MLALILRNCYIIISLHHAGKRKPSPDFYLHAVDHLNVDPASCIFIDDRLVVIDVTLVLVVQRMAFVTCSEFLPLQDVQH